MLMRTDHSALLSKEICKTHFPGYEFLVQFSYLELEKFLDIASKQAAMVGNYIKQTSCKYVIVHLYKRRQTACSSLFWYTISTLKSNNTVVWLCVAHENSIICSEHHTFMHVWTHKYRVLHNYGNTHVMIVFDEKQSNLKISCIC